MRRWTLSPALFWWATVGLSIHLLGGLGVSRETTQILLASVGLAHAVVGFWTDGRQRLTAPCIYFFAAGLFIYFPGIYMAFHDPITRGAVSLVPALTFSFFAQLLMYYVFWKPRDAGTADVLPSANRSVTTWGIWWGLILVAIGTGLSIANIGDVALVNGAAFTGVALLAVSSLRRSKRVTLFAYAIIGATFYAYMTYVFSGFGRLELGGLALCIAMAAAHRWRGRAVKAALLLGIGPGLVYLAESRAAFTATLNPNQAATVNGLESVISPMARFGQLIDLEALGSIAHTYGMSFFSTLVVLVPRQVWPDKPIGFGAELAAFFRPDLAGTGHSELALFSGEWLFAFGFFGLAVMVPVVGYLVRWIDVAMVRAQGIELNDRRSLLAIVAITIIGASIVDLMWGGSFTYMARVAPRLLILFVLFAVFAWEPKAREVRPTMPSPAYRHIIRQRQTERAKV